MSTRLGKRLLLSALVLVTAAPVAMAKPPRAVRSARDIDQILENARAGDRIVLRGVVRHDVTITTPGVTILFRSGGFAGNVNVLADGVTIAHARFKGVSVASSANQTAVTTSRFRGGGVMLAGDGAVASDNQFRGQTFAGPAVSVSGGGAVVSGNDISSYTDGVLVTGDGAAVTDNVVHATAMNSIVVQGSDANVATNVVTETFSGPAIAVIGNDAVVSGNTIAIANGGAFVQGTNPTITDNSVSVESGLDTGIVAVGDGATVTGNAVTAEFWLDAESGSGDGIGVYGNGGTVSSNDVTGDFVGGAGIRVEGNANELDGNTVHDAYGVYGVVVSGSENEASNTTVDEIDGEGVVVNGASNTVSDTSVADVSSCGVLLYSATTLDGCTVTRCGMGVVNLAQGSTIVNSQVQGNGDHDLIDIGRVTSTTGSSVGTTENNAWSFPVLTDMRRAGYRAARVPTWQFRTVESCWLLNGD